MTRDALPAAAFSCALAIVAASQQAPAAQRAAPPAVTYYKDVAPIQTYDSARPWERPSKPRCSRRRCRRGLPTPATDIS